MYNHTDGLHQESFFTETNDYLIIVCKFNNSTIYAMSKMLSSPNERLCFHFTLLSINSRVPIIAVSDVPFGSLFTLFVGRSGIR